MPGKRWKQVIFFFFSTDCKVPSPNISTTLIISYYIHPFSSFKEGSSDHTKNEGSSKWYQKETATEQFSQFFVISKTAVSKTRQAKVWGFFVSLPSKLPKLIQFSLILMGSWNDISSSRQEEFILLNSKMFKNIYSHRNIYIY